MSSTHGTATRQALDTLAAAAAEPCSTTALAVVVRILEQAAAAPLGDVDAEVTVVLQRRFVRAVYRLPEGALTPAHLEDLAAGLRRTPGTSTTRGCGRLVAVPARTTC